jgi:hypothetical protein
MARKHINIRAGFDLQGFSTSAQNLEREFKKTARKMQSIGKTLSMSLTAPIVGLAGLSVVNFDKQAKSIAQVEAALTSTGGTVGKTSKELQKMAAELQNISLFGDEDILQNITAQLLTFTNIVGDEFGRAQQAVADYASRTGRDLMGTSVMIGKALNDPIKGLAALGKAGVQFTDDQKVLIQSLVATGRAADAQKLILGELEKQYGGSAKAAADAGMGPLQQIKNSIMDVTEAFGEIIVEYIKPLADKVKALATRFGELSDSKKRLIVIISGFAAAIGPVMLALGFLGSTLIPALIAGFGMLASPVGLFVVALGGVTIAIYKIYKSWDDLINRIKRNLAVVGMSLIKSLIPAAETIDAVFKKVGINLGLSEMLQSKAQDLHQIYDNLKKVNKESEKLGDTKQPQKAASPFAIPTDNETTPFTQLQSKLADIQFAGAQRLREIRHEVAIMGMRDEEDIALERLRFAQESATREIDFEIGKLNKKSSLNADEKAQLENLQNEKKALTELHLREMEALELDSKDVILKREEAALKKKNDLLQLENANAAATQEEYNKAEKEREENHLRALIDLRKEYGKEVTDLEIQLAEKKFEIQKGANEKAESLAADLGMLITSQIQALVSGTVDAMSQFIEDAFSGVEGQQKDFGQAFMGILGKFMGDFGKAMIALGVAQMVLKAGIESINPVAIIAGGIALAAAGAAITGLSKKGLSGGESSSASPSISGGYSNIDTEPIVLETRIEGSELILIQNRSNSFRR